LAAKDFPAYGISIRFYPGQREKSGNRIVTEPVKLGIQVQSVCVFWRTLDRNVAALQDRGHVLLFEPGAAEVHRQAGTWFDDAEIYEWFGRNLHRVREPSMRHYVRARELKAAGMDWTDVLAAEAENPRELLASGAYTSTAERVQAFMAQGGGCRATFFNYRRYLLE
jgi:hypothetical protein